MVKINMSIKIIILNKFHQDSRDKILHHNLKINKERLNKMTHLWVMKTLMILQAKIYKNIRDSSFKLLIISKPKLTKINNYLLEILLRTKSSKINTKIKVKTCHPRWTNLLKISMMMNLIKGLMRKKIS